jgi:hypothetical protein
MCKNLDSLHPLTPNPKDGILLTRINKFWGFKSPASIKRQVLRWG